MQMKILMIDTWISLKLILILLLGILILDEIFIGIQTAETLHFSATRAQLVGLDSTRADDFFNRSILDFLIFTKRSPFFSIQNLQTTHQNGKLTTKLQMSTRYGNIGSYETSSKDITP